MIDTCVMHDVHSAFLHVFGNWDVFVSGFFLPQEQRPTGSWKYEFTIWDRVKDTGTPVAADQKLSPARL